MAEGRWDEDDEDDEFRASRSSAIQVNRMAKKKARRAASARRWGSTLLRGDGMRELLLQPSPWYVAGPLIGLFHALLLLLGNRLFGVSSNLRHACAAIYPGSIAYFRYGLRRDGIWNLVFAPGILVGGFIAGAWLRNPDPVAIAARTKVDLLSLGIRDFPGLVPTDVFSWASLLSARGWAVIGGGGFLVGFGTAYAGGCTCGHGLSGVADLQGPSLLALLAFFVGGVAGTFHLWPLLMGR